MLKNKQGAYVPCLSNVVAILTHRKEWRNVIAYDAFAGVVVKAREPEWCDDTIPEGDATGDWTRNDSRRVVTWITREYNCPVTTNVVEEAVQAVADRWHVHPVRDYINETPKWDRKKRLDSFLVRAAGADDNAYVRAVTKNFFLAAVARVFRPGCKVDTMLILEGPQNMGKSTLFRALASEPWFLDTLFAPGTKDGYQALRRKWIIEWPELAGLGRFEIARVKAFITSTTDSYRPPYGTATIDFPRQCVFVGTVNPDGGGYLNDPTGLRRFNPVAVKKINLRLVRAERDQLWAEAHARYIANEPWHLNDSKLLRAAADEADKRRESDPWEAHFRTWLSEHNRTVRGVTTEELLTKAVGMRKDVQDRSAQTKAGRVLHAIGWTVIRRGTDGVRRYFPGKNASKGSA